MRVNLVRCFAVLLGLAYAPVSHAEFGQNSQGQYVPPKKWSNFNSVPSAEKTPALISVPAAPQQSQATEELAPKNARITQKNRDRENSTPARPLATYAEYTAPTAKPMYVRPVSTGHTGARETLDPPTESHSHAQPSALAAPHPTPMIDGATDGYSVYDDSSLPSSSCYADAAAAPWDDCGLAPSATCGPALACAPRRLPLSPWFAGGNVLLWSFADNDYRRFLIMDGMPRSTVHSTDHVSPDFTAGYDLFVGRYFDCGRYGLSVNYMSFDPGREENVDTMPSYAAMPHWDQISLDHDGVGGAQTVYDIYDNADAHRVRRDVSIQGLELTLSCFGISGARRLPPACGTGLGKGPLVGLKRRLGLGTGYGCTSAGGPLERPCFGAAQVVTSHGFRWFQFEDEFEFASSDAADGYTGATDVFYDSNVSNDLYGYQFGSRLTYCLGRRLVANFGGKAGIYGNDVFVQQQLGTTTANAYVTTTNEMINTRDRDVVLAGLGELDLGLGYRLCDGWTLNGGYRMLYASGVATSIGSIPNDYYSVGPSARAAASDSLLLHGAYFGTAFNW